MNYLDELLAGYRQGLADNPQPTQTVRAALSQTGEPQRRGALLGLLAQALVARASNASTNETPDEA